MAERCASCGRASGHSETCYYCARQEERERIVAWLRRQPAYWTPDACANAIEKGALEEHDVECGD